MNSIGLRVTPDAIFYSIVKEEADGYDIISISNIRVPKALDDPCKLSYIRNTIGTIIKQYSINKAGIKLIEGNAKTKISANTLLRINLEGVVLELFANSSIEKYLLGRSPNIASMLGIQLKPVKEMVEDLDVDDSYKTDDGKKLSDENKESIVVAIAVLS